MDIKEFIKKQKELQNMYPVNFEGDLLISEDMLIDILKDYEKVVNKNVLSASALDTVKNTDMKDKMLNGAEILSIKRLRAQKVPFADIADRIGISEERVRVICDKLNRKRSK